MKINGQFYVHSKAMRKVEYKIMNVFHGWLHSYSNITMSNMNGDLDIMYLILFPQIIHQSNCETATENEMESAFECSVEQNKK